MYSKELLKKTARYVAILSICQLENATNSQSFHQICLNIQFHPNQLIPLVSLDLFLIQ